MPYMDTYDDNTGFAPIRAAREAGVTALGRPTVSQIPDVLTAIWEGPPGSYDHPGAAQGEVFFVTQGTGKLILQGVGEFDLQPNSIAIIPPNLPSTLVVTSTLRKFAVVPGLVVSPDGNIQV